MLEMSKKSSLWQVGWFFNWGFVLLYGFMQFSPAIYDFVSDATSLNELKGVIALAVMLGICYSHVVFSKVLKLRDLNIAGKKSGNAIYEGLVDCFAYGVTPIFVMFIIVGVTRLALPFNVLIEVHNLFDVSFLILTVQNAILLGAILHLKTTALGKC